MNPTNQIRVVLAIGWEQGQSEMTLGEPRHLLSTVINRDDPPEAQLAALQAAFDEAKAGLAKKESTMPQRVLCVSHTAAGKVFIFGEGNYVGDTIPSEEAQGMGPMMRERKALNPTIELDSGEVIYGCECWWGPLDAANKKYAELERVPTSITEARAKAREATLFATTVKVGDRVIIPNELKREADNFIVPAGTEGEVLELLNEGEAVKLRVVIGEATHEIATMVDGLKFATVQEQASEAPASAE